MLALATPATLADCLAVLAPDGKCHRVVWLHVRHQVAIAPSYAMRDETGRALVICGFMPWSDAVEVWMVAGPGAGPRLLELLALARLTMAEQGQDDTRPFTAVVRTRQGQRIARLLGFERHGQLDQLYVREKIIGRTG